MSDIDKLLSDYDNRLQQNITATEKNEQSRQQYISDFFYLVLKCILFIILGLCYYIFIKDTKTGVDSVKGVVDIVKNTANQIKNKVEEIKKEKINPIKPNLITKIDIPTNSKQNTLKSNTTKT
jgi:hypothetical protein